jgi:Aspartyl protease
MKRRLVASLLLVIWLVTAHVGHGFSFDGKAVAASRLEDEDETDGSNRRKDKIKTTPTRGIPSTPPSISSHERYSGALDKTAALTGGIESFDDDEDEDVDDVAELGCSKDGSVDIEDDEGSFEPLRVMCEVNGFMIPAIIDTGAQITIMSASCAQRCRLSNSIDSRYAGRAVGVGSTDILGRITGLPMSDTPVDFLIGMDFLKRFKCEVSFRDSVLKLQVRNQHVRVPLVADQTLGIREDRAVFNSYGSGSSSGSRDMREDIDDEEEEDVPPPRAAAITNSGAEKSKSGEYNSAGAYYELTKKRELEAQQLLDQYHRSDSRHHRSSISRHGRDSHYGKNVIDDIEEDEEDCCTDRHSLEGV